MQLSGKTVALCVTGSIAAYKAILVARRLKQAGARVLPIMTESATKFVGEVTFSGITGERVCSNMWDPSFRGEMHIEIAKEADVVAIVPATADVLSRLAQGRADDLVTALALSARGPVICAPAMHPRMWEHPATQANVLTLAQQGRVELVGPVLGEVASGEHGVGRMAEPEDIVVRIARALGPLDLRGRHVVVSAGPTFEAWDPVRFLGNRSSGKMGHLVASRAFIRGAKVTLVSGPVALPVPPGVHRVDVESARDMQAELLRALGADLLSADALVMAAAVADYRPQVTHHEKIKTSRSTGAMDATGLNASDTIPNTSLPMVMLTENPDILAGIGEARAKGRGSRPVLVGFALETGTDDAMLEYAKKKRAEKRVDFVVANHAREALGKDDTRVWVVSENTVDAFPVMSKERVADLILDEVARRLAGSDRD
jgi:phosphopantothenoylcysteine decarboxylase/phosphopantothenate--cysteine ligase